MSTTQIIEKQSGAAFKIKKGDRVYVIDPQGEQVSDMVLFNAFDPGEKLSAGKTFDFEETILLSRRNHLWSNRGNRMALITEDTNGRNDFLLAPCSQKTFEIMYGHRGAHPSCHQNLSDNLAPFGLSPDEIPTAFNVFMNVQFDPDGKISVEPPTSKAGDYLVIQAMMDLIVGLTACSAPDSNNGSFKPIHYRVESSR
jgi:hypothetical protein